MNLGHWQWSKGDLRERQAQSSRVVPRRAQPLGNRRLEDVPRFQRIRVKGELDPDRQFLLDNRTNEGRPGYEVLTPLYFEAAERSPDPRRSRLDPVQRVPRPSCRTSRLPGHVSVEITGRVDELPIEEASRAAGRRRRLTHRGEGDEYIHAAELQ